MVIGEILARTAERLPAKTAIVADGRTQTYAQLDAMANRVANALAAAGFGKGATAAICSANHFDYPAIHFGAARSGCVLAHMSPRSTADYLVGLAATVGPRLLFAHADQADAALDAVARSPDIQTVVCFGGPAPAGAVAFEDFIAGAPETPPDVTPDESDPAGITYSSGSTGLPKGVLVSHGARALSATIAAETFGVREDDVLSCVTPMAHVVGLYVWFQAGIALGCTMVLQDQWDFEAFVATIAAHGVTAGLLVPTQVHGLLNHPDFNSERLAGLRYLNYAGAPMPAAAVERALDALPDVAWCEHYGQSEACPLTLRTADDPRTKAASVGRALPGVELAILGADDTPVADSEPGEIAVRGATLMLGYVGAAEESDGLYAPDGWLKTGDVGFLDRDGFLYLVDRSKDMIISGGENIFPSEIENALYLHDSVAECAVFGIPDDHWGELPAAHVVIGSGAAPTEEELIAFVAARIPRHKRPRMIKIVDALPKTSIGKIQKNLIRAEYWQGRDRAI